MKFIERMSMEFIDGRAGRILSDHTLLPTTISETVLSEGCCIAIEVP